MSEDKRLHLELAQGVINRLANNSFMIKGWSVTLVAALLALGSLSADRSFFFLAYIPVIVFWGLDAYFLWQERLFRELYNNICEKKEGSIDFSMNTQPFTSKATWGGAAFSITLLPFHGSLIVSVLAVFILGI